MINLMKNLGDHGEIIVAPYLLRRVVVVDRRQKQVSVVEEEF
jgi:hypothetical protein